MLAPVSVSSSQRKDETARVSRAPPDLVIAVDFLVSLGILPDRRSWRCRVGSTVVPGLARTIEGDP